ncbi:MAG: ATP-binding cassette domain-containing protein [Candidatus Edwardsbacteria bacterium]|nr:ATP-binding cassette domain-containing protein [Candidatus Edwardsbacteria bacterium]
MRIAARTVSKRFSGRQVLSGVSLDIDRPGVYALSGPNGSGKTTLMRILALLDGAEQGEISFNDRIVNVNKDKASAQTLRQKMAMIHNPAVMLSGNVEYNVGYGLKVRGKRNGETGERVNGILDKLLLTGFGKRHAKKLSAGETQRVALARAMALEPEVIFLDEPTANLDPMSARLIEDAVKDMAAAGKRVIVASHNLWQVERIADWLWFLNEGKLTLSGPVADVLHKGDHKVWSEFLGRDNLFAGEVRELDGRKTFLVDSARFEIVSDINGTAMASLNPTDIILAREAVHTSARNVMEGVITEAVSEGGLYKVTVDVGLPLAVAITKASWDEMGLKQGEQVYAVFKASAVRVWREE